MISLIEKVFGTKDLERLRRLENDHLAYKCTQYLQEKYDGFGEIELEIQLVQRLREGVPNPVKTSDSPNTLLVYGFAKTEADLQTD